MKSKMNFTLTYPGDAPRGGLLVSTSISFRSPDAAPMSVLDLFFFLAPSSSLETFSEASTATLFFFSELSLFFNFFNESESEN